MKLTKFGIFIRKYRIDHNITLREMARDIGISASYLSSIEHGQRPVPNNLEKKLINVYQLNTSTIYELKDSLYNSCKQYTFRPKSEIDRQLFKALKIKFDLLSYKFKLDMIVSLNNIK